MTSFSREVYIVSGKKSQARDTIIIAVCGSLQVARVERIRFLGEYPLVGSATIKPFIVQEKIDD